MLTILKPPPNHPNPPQRPSHLHPRLGRIHLARSRELARAEAAEVVAGLRATRNRSGPSSLIGDLPVDLLGVDSLSIPFNHCSFQKNKKRRFFWVSGGFPERRSPGKNGEVTLETSIFLDINCWVVILRMDQILHLGWVTRYACRLISHLPGAMNFRPSSNMFKPLLLNSLLSASL